ncbi:SGNH/GDSL hydrolase family protein [Streptomyces sp. NPDC050263]|uniref:SGNH/GDSL hydrolase family protein n=1 Tax=Streptomyces sp. NPDC050263 TaxID=3155037 RepID=UPI00343D84D1
MSGIVHRRTAVFECAATSAVHTLCDVSSVTVPAQVYVSVDGGPERLYAVDRGDRGDLGITATGRGPHTAELSVKDVFSRVNRWAPPLESGVALTGIRGRLLERRAVRAPESVFYGDFVTQGVLALCADDASDCADGTAAHPTPVADALHASLAQVGFGRQGVLQAGHGGVPAAGDAYGWNCAGSPARPDRDADVIVVNQGADDTAFGSAEFRAACRAHLERLRAAAPYARLLALRPFGGAHAADIVAVVAELADRRTEFVDATGWLAAADGDFHDTVHAERPGPPHGGRPPDPPHRKAREGAPVNATRRRRTVAVTGDRTAPHLYTSTEPAASRGRALAQNPAYRLGRTVRGHLRSVYPDYCLGTETRRVPGPAITLPEGADRRDDHA